MPGAEEDALTAALNDLEDCDEHRCTEIIDLLQVDILRRKEHIDRLNDRLKVANNELAARQENWVKLEREASEPPPASAVARVVDASGAIDEAAEALERVLARRAERVLRMRELTDAVALAQPRGEKVIFNEAELLVNLNNEDKLEAGQVAVLVSFNPAFTDNLFHLVLRVHRDTRISEVRLDACRYFNVSPVEYVMVTHGGVVCLDGHAVADTIVAHKDILPTAQFTLKLKKPRDAAVSDLAFRLSRGNTAAAKTQSAAKEVEVDKREDDVDPRAQLEAEIHHRPGLKRLLTLQDRHYMLHLAHCKFKYLWLYSLLWALTLVIFSTHTGMNDNHWLAYPVRSALVTKPLPDVASQRQEAYLLASLPTRDPLAVVDKAEAALAGYSDVRSRDQMLRFLRTALVDALFSDLSPLRKALRLVGFVRLRQQRVRAPAPEQCGGDAVIGNCVSQWYDSGTRQEGMLNISAWSAGYPLGVDGRGQRDPRVFLPADLVQNTAGRTLGLYQTYDRSGYVADYDLQHHDLTAVRAAFLNDLEVLAEHTLDVQTRAVFVDFTLYSPANDVWLSNELLFETPAIGLVEPKSWFTSFRPNIAETPAEFDAMYCDIARALLVLYMLFRVLPYRLRCVRTEYYYERLSMEEQDAKQGMDMNELQEEGVAAVGRITGVLHSLYSPATLVDWSLVACYFTSVFIRLAPSLLESTAAYAQSLSSQAAVTDLLATSYRIATMAEIFFMCLSAAGLVLNLRLNRFVHVIVRTGVLVWRELGWFLLVFFPAFVGCCVFAYTTWGPAHEPFNSVPSAALALLMLAHGEVNIAALREQHIAWTSYALIVFILGLGFLALNLLLAVLIDSHYTVFIEHGGLAATMRNWTMRRTLPEYHMDKEQIEEWKRRNPDRPVTRYHWRGKDWWRWVTVPKVREQFENLKRAMRGSKKKKAPNPA